MHSINHPFSNVSAHKSQPKLPHNGEQLLLRSAFSSVPQRRSEYDACGCTCAYVSVCKSQSKLPHYGKQLLLSVVFSRYVLEAFGAILGLRPSNFSRVVEFRGGPFPMQVTFIP